MAVAIGREILPFKTPHMKCFVLQPHSEWGDDDHSVAPEF
jgi:hypothetical protein